MKNKITWVLLLLVVGAGIYYMVSSMGGPKPPVKKDDGPKRPAPAELRMSMVANYQFDTACYTEGMEFYKGKLYCSGGEYGKSMVGQYDAKTGAVIKKKMLDKSIFGEGITILGDKLYMLTWKENKVLLFNPETLEQTGSMDWKLGEGWGMTNDGKNLIANTGGSTIFFLNPADLSVVRTISVTDEYGPVAEVNEMEYLNGFIYANVFTTDQILKIDANSGQVAARITLSSLLPGYNRDGPQAKEGRYLNGIAYNAATQTFFITGKEWPKMFEVKFE